MVRTAGKAAVIDFERVVKSELGKKPAKDTLAQPNIIGEREIVFTCTSGCKGDWHHTIKVTKMSPGGAFSGTGHYNPDKEYTWNVSGNISGSEITFTLTYTGKNKGYTVTCEGIVDKDGTMSGTGTSGGQKQTWRM